MSAVASVEAERRPLIHRVIEAGRARPLWAVAIVSAVLRVGFAVIDAVVTKGVLIPDEAQYLGLAHWIAAGRNAAGYGDGFGRSLLEHTPAFVWPLAVLDRLLGPHRLPGALFAATFGVGAVVLATWLATKVVRRDLALGMGLVLAAMPSQVLFSSVVLRESLIWTSVILLAVAAHRAAGVDEVRRLVVPAALAATALLMLGWLRDQTLVVAAWTLVPAVLVGTRRLRWHRVAGALALALLVPVAGGIGVGGEQLVRVGGSSLGRVRTNLSMSADSAFTATTTTIVDRSDDGTTGAGPGGKTLVKGYKGETYVVDDSAGGSLRAAPRGLVAVLFRPFPWEGGDGSIRAAAAEDLLWYPLYVLAAVGAVVGWRRRMTQLVFPVLLAAGLVALAAISQGNLGTSFRHRGQILWVVVLLGAVGFDPLVARWRARHRADR